MYFLNQNRIQFNIFINPFVNLIVALPCQAVILCHCLMLSSQYAPGLFFVIPHAYSSNTHYLQK